MTDIYNYICSCL